MRCILMNHEHETLAFEVDSATGKVHNVRPLDGAPWAPLGILVSWSKPEPLLEHFIRGRAIQPNRPDLPDILKATGMQSNLELSLLSGGFSLSDQYWYRTPGSKLTWEQANFFDNEWDPSFGEAVLRRDFDALSHASIATPNATCGGLCRKAWILKNGKPHLLKAASIEGGADSVAEALASRMLAHILPSDEYVPYEVLIRDGETYASCQPMVNRDEELVAAWQILSQTGGTRDGQGCGSELLGAELFEGYCTALEDFGVAGAKQEVAKMALAATLTFNRDIHSRNMGVIRTVETGDTRMAPLFDYDKVFGTSKMEYMDFVCIHPAIAPFMLAAGFSNLNPLWDYSWYDPHALDGFESEVARTLSNCSAIPKGYAQHASQAFVAQLDYVRYVVAQSPSVASAS